MLLATDVYYFPDYAHVAGILFDWHDAHPVQELSLHHPGAMPYRPGAFYERELPCILALLASEDLSALDAIVVDGFVYTGNDYAPGLGARLHDAIGGACPVIGVAKTSFFNTDQVCIPVLRGQSRSPLFVSAIGADAQIAAEKVRLMHGEHRIPTLLKKLDQLSREAL